VRLGLDDDADDVMSDHVVKLAGQLQAFVAAVIAETQLYPR
jgi:hypothetical protein